jgi:hypothetical protein
MLTNCILAKYLIINMFYIVPPVPRGKMERFAAIGSKKADLRVGEPVNQSGAYDKVHLL